MDNNELKKVVKDVLLDWKEEGKKGSLGELVEEVDRAVGLRYEGTRILTCWRLAAEEMKQEQAEQEEDLKTELKEKGVLKAAD